MNTGPSVLSAGSFGVYFQLHVRREAGDVSVTAVETSRGDAAKMV